MTGYADSMELASYLKDVIKELILEFNLDIDYGVDVIFDSPDLDKKIFKEVLKYLKKDIKIIYVHLHVEPGFYIKRICWRGKDIVLGVRPAIL